MPEAYSSSTMHCAEFCKRALLVLNQFARHFSGRVVAYNYRVLLVIGEIALEQIAQQVTKRNSINEGLVISQLSVDLVLSQTN